jgi:adenylate cyclase
MNVLDTKPIAGWLIDGARSAAGPDQVVAALCDRMVGAGVPLWRVAVFVRTLHPQVMGRRFSWRHGGGVDVAEARHDAIDTPELSDSVVSCVYDTGSGVRHLLSDGATHSDSALLAQLRREAATDFLALPLTFSDGSIHVATWATRQRGGFTAAQIAGIETILAPLARIAEILALRRTATNLLDTYVGHKTGERILSGHIRRGETQAIEAAIWLSDMRGFTARSDRLPPQVLIDLLNRYFDCQVPTITAHGGEVLKFMGDGLLAIFPIAGRASAIAKACASAIAAALAARADVAELGTGASDLVERLRFGLALHVGEVLYGNIGSGNRLDFTCIGPAINLAARIEKLTGKLGRTILVSSEFARHCPDALTCVGEFEFAGFTAAQAVFGLVDEP